MMLAEDSISYMGFSPADITPSDGMYFDGAVEWLAENTDFKIDLEDPEDSVAELPANAKIFIAKFVGMLKGGGLSGSAVTSESIGGMSKSYGSVSEGERSLWLVARQLLGVHLKRGVVRIKGAYSAWA